jgi:hypothetical protein
MYWKEEPSHQRYGKVGKKRGNGHIIYEQDQIDSSVKSTIRTAMLTYRFASSFGGSRGARKWLPGAPESGGNGHASLKIGA